MKNVYLLVLLISILLITSCSKKEEKYSGDISKAKLESIDLKGEKVSLRYKFEKGDKLKYKLTAITSTFESIQADSLMQSKSNQTTTYIFDIEVLDVDDDKTAELSLNISSLKINADINGQKITFDSNVKLTPEEQQKYFEYLSIHNTPYRARVSEKGEVIEVSRLDKIIDKMNSLQPQKQNLTAEQKSQFAKNLGDALIKPITQLLFRELPKKSLAKDSTWQKNYPGQLSIFKIDNTITYKVEDFFKINNDKAAKLSANLSCTWTGNKKGEDNGIKYNFNDPKISGSGNILFNIDKGILIKAETETSVEIVATLEVRDETQKLRKAVRKDYTLNKNIIELL
ncbi:DUF6263 family protein [Rosettibacter firmus]|uniref:DUF6263 family protein n=1 Tax=Rosettibacter firmus TaxID=3111522 RepID=UPI00336BB0B2